MGDKTDKMTKVLSSRIDTHRDRLDALVAELTVWNRVRQLGDDQHTRQLDDHATKLLDLTVMLGALMELLGVERCMAVEPHSPDTRYMGVTNVDDEWRCINLVSATDPSTGHTFTDGGRYPYCYRHMHRCTSPEQAVPHIMALPAYRYDMAIQQAAHDANRRDYIGERAGKVVAMIARKAKP